MKKLVTGILSLVSLYLVQCNQPSEQKKEENPAIDIVRKSIAAHGGWDLWIQMEELDYDKSIIMYDSTGEIESKMIQIHNYRFKPEYNGRITWSTDHIYRVSYDNQGAIKIVDEIPQFDSASIVEAYTTMMSSHYVLFQPWKLFDPGVKLQYVGKDQLDDSTKVDVVKVDFTIGVDPTSKQDVWWFYFDESSALLAGYLVKHEGRLSFIRNVSYDSTMDMVFPRHRFSHYVTDTARHGQLLRAEYYYENFALR